MSNQSIKINLTKIPGAALVNLKGNTATKQCIVIPVEDANLYVGEKGVYLNLVAFQYREPKFADTHMIKQDLDKEVYDALTEEQRKALPILGGMKPMVTQQHPMEATTGTMEVVPTEGGDGLPF